MSGKIRRGTAGACVFAFAFFCAIVSFGAAPAQARYAHIVIDANNGKVLDAQNADTIRYPASLTKMMTLYLTFEALHKGRLTLDQRITMSKNGAATIPSKLWVRAGTTFTVREAIYGMIVKSANDLAEGMGDHLGGSEAKFGQMMTRKARQLGMTKTVFRNASGLPNKSQVTTARDMARLGLALQRDFPREYKMFNTTSFKFRGKTIRGHNRMLTRYKGVDGIKTGYTNASGFNIVSAVNHNGHSVVAVVLGGKTGRSRDDQVVTLLDRTLPKASRSRGNEQLIASANTSRTLDISPSAVPLPMFAERPSKKIASANSVMTDMIQTAAIEQTPTNHRSHWEVQIAASDSESAALSLLKTAQPSLASGHGVIAPYTEAVRSGGSTLYRARFTGFDNQADAVSACKDLKAKSYSCVVMTSNG